MLHVITRVSCRSKEVVWLVGEHDPTNGGPQDGNWGCWGGGADTEYEVCLMQHR